MHSIMSHPKLVFSVLFLCAASASFAEAATCTVEKYNRIDRTIVQTYTSPDGCQPARNLCAADLGHDPMRIFGCKLRGAKLAWFSGTMAMGWDSQQSDVGRFRVMRCAEDETEAGQVGFQVANIICHERMQTVEGDPHCQMTDWSTGR